jgi:hypothetical protein
VLHHRHHHHHHQHRGRQRANVRGRPATKDGADHPVRGTLSVQIATNGVRVGGAAEMSSQASTPVGDGGGTTNGMRAGPWKKEETRALRSKAGGTRLKSDLAVYFSNFDDIITGAPKSTGMGNRETEPISCSGVGC